MVCSLLLDSVNLSWVACWVDALDLQPSMECTWVGSFFLSPSTECSLLLDSVNLSWVACWVDALDLQPSMECTWVGLEAFFYLHQQSAVCRKKFSATSSTASDAIVGFTDAPSFS
jgi:hypothetical protein